MTPIEHFVGLDHFAASEFDEPEKMDPTLLMRLDKARHVAGVPFKITSDFRGGDGSSAHDYGFAVDIRCPKEGHGHERWLIITSLLAAEFTRIGIYDKHIHADVGDLFLPGRFSASVMWWGVSK